MTHLGKGSGHKLEFHTHHVVKRGVPSEEPLFMMAHQDVFVPVYALSQHREDEADYTMPLYEAPKLKTERAEALMSGLDKLQMLWAKPYQPGLIGSKVHWRRQLLLHIQAILEMQSVVVPDGIFKHVWGIPNPTSWRLIHGDPTLANLVKDHTGNWWWLDPLNRPYIPDDPHVDLGKLFQSCGGYELIITGEQGIVKNDVELMRHLARRAGLSLEVGLMWYIIHIVRLMPYQDLRVRRIYAKYLETVL